MQKKARHPGVFAVVAIVVLYGAWLYFNPSTPDARFKALFSDLSIGVPAYEKLLLFEQPPDSVQGDFCNVEFTQTPAQFEQFLTALGVTRDRVLSPNSATVKANSKMNPNSPWMLEIKAWQIIPPDQGIKIHLEGRQPYNSTPTPAPPGLPPAPPSGTN